MAEDKSKGRKTREMYFGLAADANPTIDADTDVVEGGDFTSAQTHEVAGAWSVSAHVTTVDYVDTPAATAFLQYRRTGQTVWTDLPGSERQVPATDGAVLLQSVIEGNLASDIEEIRIAFKNGSFNGGADTFDIDISETFMIVRKSNQ